MSLNTCLLIMLGGAIGTLLRYLISIMTTTGPHQLPWSTIVINISGSFFVGFFGTITLANGRFPASENVRLFVMVGDMRWIHHFLILQLADVRPHEEREHLASGNQRPRICCALYLCRRMWTPFSCPFQWQCR
jgi:hypothetical protein